MAIGQHTNVQKLVFGVLWLLNACPCINPKDNNIAESPPFVGHNYFYVKYSIMITFHRMVIYTGTNTCCLFNTFCGSIEYYQNPLQNRIKLNKDLSDEDLATEVIDIYVY